MAQTVTPPETPNTHLQIWNANLHQLRDNWRGFIQRLSVNQFAPDIITFQDVSRCDGNGDGTGDWAQLMTELRRVFPDTGWQDAHQEANQSSCATRNAIVWSTDRFYLQVSPPTRWAQSCGGVSSDGGVAVALGDRQRPLTSNGGSVVAASVHFNNQLTKTCLRDALTETHQKINSSASNWRDVTIIAGDFNQRPDKAGVTPEPTTEGLETDPDCWYRNFSAAHAQQRMPNSTYCGGIHADYFYDTVWLHPLSGGLTNPTATSFCQQFTRTDDYDPVPPDEDDLGNSCTDLNGGTGNGYLDRSRIDYIWVGWDSAPGQRWTPPAAVAAGFIEYASADTGLDLDSVTRYSDHRAVQALMMYPPGVRVQ